MRYGIYKSVPVSEIKCRAETTVEKLRKKMPHINPVVIQGRKLARTWWGEAWNQNLESYQDYAYRIERGRSYVRNGLILHLEISSGHIEALVQGRRKTPYTVNIRIDPLSAKVWDHITRTCKGKIDSMQDLLSGKFPEGLSELFTEKGMGVFPSPEEIRFSCSCPDVAYMCKHVAAVMYGIGSRLDQDPSLFFILRNVNVEELISEAVKQKSDELLTKAGRKSSRTIAGNNLSAMFGIELESNENSKDTKPASKPAKPSGTPKRRGRPPKKAPSVE